MEWSNFLLKAGIGVLIFGASMIQSRFGNKLYYAMQDHLPIRAGLYDLAGNLLGWVIAIVIWGNLIVNFSFQTVWWTVYFALCDSCGDPLVTGWDVEKHGRKQHDNSK